MKIKNPLTKGKTEKIIGLRMEKSYNRVFESLEKEFPMWISFDLLNKTYKFAFISEEDLIKLSDEGFLESKEDYKIILTGIDEWSAVTGKDGKYVKKKYFRLSNKGFEFINHLRARKTNNLLFILTLIISYIGFVHIQLTIFQIILQYKVLLG